MWLSSAGQAGKLRILLLSTSPKEAAPSLSTSAWNLVAESPSSTWTSSLVYSRNVALRGLLNIDKTQFLIRRVEKLMIAISYTGFTIKRSNAYKTLWSTNDI